MFCLLPLYIVYYLYMTELYNKTDQKKKTPTGWSAVS